MKTTGLVGKFSPTLLKSMVAGAISGTIEETMDAINDYREDGKQSVGARLLSVGINTVIAGAGDALFTAASNGLAGVKKIVNGSIREVKFKEVNGTAKAKAEVDGKARELEEVGSKGEVTKSTTTLKKVDWNEYKRVDDYKPMFIDEFQEKEYKAASKDYNDIKSAGMTDIEQVAKNTGMTIEDIKAMKQHMFFDTHKIPLDNQSYRVGYFTPDLDIGFIWKLARKVDLDPKQKKWFQELAKHELTESEKMKQGYPYKNPGSYQKDSDDFGSDPPGAHDIASDQPSFELPGAYDYYSKKVLEQ